MESTKQLRIKWSIKWLKSGFINGIIFLKLGEGVLLEVCQLGKSTAKQIKYFGPLRAIKQMLLFDEIVHP